MTDIDLTKPHRTRDGWKVTDLTRAKDGGIIGLIHPGDGRKVAHWWLPSGAHPTAPSLDLIPIKTAEEVIEEELARTNLRPSHAITAEDVANALREAGIIPEGK